MTDAFNAVAEPRRREILDLLTTGERPVNDLVERLGLTQPQVSRHLRVLREAGLVHVRDAGRQRLYRLDPEPLKAIHDWLNPYDVPADVLTPAACPAAIMKRAHRRR